MSRILPIELKEFDATAVTANAQNFGSVLSNPAIKISILNTGNADVYVSCITGVTQTFRVPAGAAITLDESTLYFRGVDQEYYLPKGAQLLVYQVDAPSTIAGYIICHLVTRQLS